MEKQIVCLLLVAAVVVMAIPGEYKPPPKPYSFSYGVKDPYAGSDFGQEEKSDGNTVQGSYSVQLPDGRKQVVNYQADHDVGFVAKVSYEGQAQYPSKGAPPITFPPSKGGYH
ncbi:Cuticle protein [Armadillidium nasatum]|uniref:Cuticle protein n=1 Tax=Armadillidium nasatum TaxID=96803 RepID=A0A5N5TNA4_9CRUS|nr:Cuticle protein [Armadillidium nasatum]